MIPMTTDAQIPPAVPGAPSGTPATAGQKRGYIVVFLVLAIACALVWIRFNYAPRPLRRVLPDLGPAPAFSLTERSGAKVDSASLAGKVWIADFIFTRCAGACPAMSTQMRDLQGSFRKTPEVVLVSFSVDPEHDTPDALDKYAGFYTAQPGRWLFLAGGPGEVATLAVDGFKLATSATADPAAGDAPAVVHSQKFVLVDGAGRIRGYYDGTDSETVQKLIRDVSALRAIERETPAP